MKRPELNEVVAPESPHPTLRPKAAKSLEELAASAAEKNDLSGISGLEQQIATGEVTLKRRPYLYVAIEYLRDGLFRFSLLQQLTNRAPAPSLFWPHLEWWEVGQLNGGN